MKIKKGDKVQVLQGKDRGKTGTVERVFVKENKVLVNGINTFKRHTKPSGQGATATGGIVEKFRPLLMSKVSLVCPKCGKIARVGFTLNKESKNRICRSCKAEI